MQRKKARQSSRYCGGKNISSEYEDLETTAANGSLAWKKEVRYHYGQCIPQHALLMRRRNRLLETPLGHLDIFGDEACH